MSRVERMPYLMTLPFVFKINIIINGLKTGFIKSWSLYLSRTNSLKDMAICQSKKWKFRQNFQLGKFKYLTMVCLSVLYFGENDLNKSGSWPFTFENDRLVFKESNISNKSGRWKRRDIRLRSLFGQFCHWWSSHSKSNGHFQKWIVITHNLWVKTASMPKGTVISEFGRSLV